MFKKLVVAASFLALTSSTAIAGDAGGLVKQLFVSSSGVIFAAIEGPHNNAPFCATAGWAVNATTPAGKLTYAQLLTAQTAGDAITMSGTGTCTTWPDREDIDYTFVQK